MLVYLTLAASFGLAAAAMPGPFAAFLVSHTLSHGVRSTAPAAFSPMVSDGPIALLVLLVLSRVPDTMVQLLRLGGGLLLLYLAYEAARAFRDFRPEPPSTSSLAGGSLLRGTLVNLLNPNPYLGWSLILGPLFLEGWARSPRHGIAVLVGFYGTMVVTLLSMILLTSLAGRSKPGFHRALLGFSSLALVGFALYQLGLAFDSL